MHRERASLVQARAGRLDIAAVAEPVRGRAIPLRLVALGQASSLDGQAPTGDVLVEAVAPWGERQTAPDGYLILSGRQVYGNHAETFAATYEVVG